MVLVLPFLGTPRGAHGHDVQPFPPPGKDGMPPELAALVEHPSQQLHGEQTVEWFDSVDTKNGDDSSKNCGREARSPAASALPPGGGEFMAAAEVVGLAAKGDSGALLTVRTKLTHATTGELVAVLTMGSFIRGLPRGAAAKLIADQATITGSGSEDTPATTPAAKPAAKPPRPVPKRPPDASTMLALSSTQALLYRLASGDYNPLHADPAVSEHLGLGPKPIVHGLCTLAVASRAIVAASQAHQPRVSLRGDSQETNSKEPALSEGALVLGCGGDPKKLRALSGRFVAPAYPGEELEVQLWAGGQQLSDDSTLQAAHADSRGEAHGNGGGSNVGRAERHLVHFRVIAQPRNAVVLDFGWALVEATRGGERGQPLRPRL